MSPPSDRSLLERELHGRRQVAQEVVRFFCTKMSVQQQENLTANIVQGPRVTLERLYDDIIGSAIHDGRSDVARFLVELCMGHWEDKPPYTDMEREIRDDPDRGCKAAMAEFQRRRGPDVRLPELDLEPQTPAGIDQRVREIAVLSAAVLRAWTKRDVWELGTVVDIDDRGKAVIVLHLESEEPPADAPEDGNDYRPDTP